jgi:hypothetical protein
MKTCLPKETAAANSSGRKPGGGVRITLSVPGHIMLMRRPGADAEGLESGDRQPAFEHG